MDQVEWRLGVARVWIVESVDLRRCGGVVVGHVTISWKSPRWDAGVRSLAFASGDEALFIFVINEMTIRCVHVNLLLAIDAVRVEGRHCFLSLSLSLSLSKKTSKKQGKHLLVFFYNFFYKILWVCVLRYEFVFLFKTHLDLYSYDFQF